MLKLVEVTSGYETNWHSILEQTTGLFNGIGVAVAVAALARRTRPPRRPVRTGARGPSHSRWASSCWGSPTSILRKNVAQWVATKSMPAEMAGLSAVGLVRPGISGFGPGDLLVLWMRHRGGRCRSCRRAGSARVSSSISGCSGRLVVGNFERALVAFRAQRLVTEGVLYLVALACTLVLLLCAGPQRAPTESRTHAAGRRRTLGAGQRPSRSACSRRFSRSWPTGPSSGRSTATASPATPGCTSASARERRSISLRIAEQIGSTRPRQRRT